MKNEKRLAKEIARVPRDQHYVQTMLLVARSLDSEVLLIRKKYSKEIFRKSHAETDVSDIKSRFIKNRFFLFD